MADVKLQAVLTLKDKMTSELKKSEGSLKRWAGVAVAAAGAAAIAIGVKSVQAAIKYETAFAGVRKTVDASEEEFKQMSDAFIEMSKKFPTSANELARIGELAGQLGIAKENVVDFSKTIADIATTTNLTSEAAATDFARIINIMQESQDNVDRMGSTVVELGNNFATTEGEIVDFATRIAGAAQVSGLATSDIFGIATAFTSVGVQAERGGTAVSKTLFAMATEVENGGEKLDDFARVAGVTSDEFVTAFQEDAAGAFNMFVAGLGERGIEATGLLEELELSDARLMQAFISVAGAGGIMTDAIETAGEAFEDNTALTEEAQKRYKTTESQIEILKNTLIALGIDIGNQLLPHIQNMLKWIQDNETEIKNFIKSAMGLAKFIINVLVKAFTSITMVLENVIFWVMQTWDWFKKVFDFLVGGIGKTVFDSIADQIRGVGDAIRNVIEWFGKLKDKASGVVGNVTGFVGGLLGRQHGGSVSRGQPYMVGERGAELFVPRQGGTIVPSDKTGTSIKVDLRGATVRSDQDIQVIIEAVKNAFNRDLSIEQLGV